MKAPRLKQQAGYALIMMVLGLMGIGGVVIVGFTQQVRQDVDQQRYLHNKQVLQEAKDALLMYAYRYPEIAGNPNRGPGRLPCPDTNNNGNSNPDLTSFCIDNGTGEAMVGRFPWNAPGMEFYDARDADGNRLWYAVSQGFNFFDDASVINSDLAGSITIHDQNGQLLYDGALNGIAAVIIAPGPPIDRNGVAQDRSVANGDDPQGTVPDTDPGIVDPTNYLDIFGALDNADFVNDDSNNGFVLGPIDDLAAEELIVNDQIILVTAEEVIAMAQKATLQAYREALENYRSLPGFGSYPWLEPYDSDGDLNTFDAQVNPLPLPPAPIVGRVPSIFANYFAINNSDSQAIRTELNMLITVDGHPVDTRALASLAPDVLFRANGNLSTSFNGGASFIGYVWDGHPTNAPTLLNDGIWEACPYVLGNEEDCNQDVAGNFIGMGGAIPGESDVWLQVREVTVTFNGGVPFEFPFGFQAGALVYTPPTATSHAYVDAVYDGAGAGYISSVTWSQDDDFQASFSETPLGNNGFLTYDGGDTVTVGMRYYPELPRWAWFNGWHDMVQAAYAAELRPGGAGACVVGTDCLTVLNVSGATNDKEALLVLSGGVGDLNPLDTDLIDAGGGPLFYADDLGQIFEDENNNLDRIFDNRPATNPANDVILVME